MPQVPDTSTIIQVAKICQYLYDRALGDSRFYNNQQIDPNRPVLIYITRRDVEYLYGLDQTNPSLFKVGSYLFGLCAPYIQQALQIIAKMSVAGPAITGPANQSVNIGGDATFSVSVTGVSPFTYQWYDFNGSAIPGANSSTYTLLDAQLSDNGHTFFARVTDANGKSVTSNVAVLTVTAIITGFFGYTDTDPASALQSGSDPFSYAESFTITDGQPWIMSVPVAATPNKFIIIKGPVGQPIKTAWDNGGVNSGSIPDIAFQSTLTIGATQYYYTRQSISLDPLQTLKLS